MTGFVNSAPGFSDQPRVINGAADLLVELFGERGKPTRAAIGCQGLGGNASVEIIVTLLFSGADVRPPLARDQDRKSTTSELQSPCNLVCRLLLEKKKKPNRPT